MGGLSSQLVPNQDSIPPASAPPDIFHAFWTVPFLGCTSPKGMIYANSIKFLSFLNLKCSGILGDSLSKLSFRGDQPAFWIAINLPRMM